MRTEEKEYWVGFTWDPPFLPPSPQIPSAKPQQSTQFQTPLRRTSSVSLSVGTWTGSKKRRRSISEMDAWKEMTEYAWEIGQTAKKKQQSRNRNNKTPIDSLMKRQEGILNRVQEMEIRYGGLFGLAESASM